jgi:hypothetical protein
MHELEAKEVFATESFARKKEAVVAHRLAVTRQLDLLHQTATAGIPPFGHFSTSINRASLPHHLEVLVPPSSLGLSMTSDLTADIAALGSISPVNVAP